MNKQRLLEKMQENRISITEMYSRLGISRSAFYRKCNGLSEFTLDEIKKIMAILGENDPREIFLSRKCPKGNCADFFLNKTHRLQALGSRTSYDEL